LSRKLGYLARYNPSMSSHGRPFTFLELSENRFYTSEDELLDDLIEALRAEVEALRSSSDLIQIDEPSLVDPELGRSERLRGVDIVNEFLMRRVLEM